VSQGRPPPGRAEPGLSVPALAGLDVPARLAGWSVAHLRSGLWLADRPGPVPPEVLALRAEPGQLNVVLAASGPDERTDAVISELLPRLTGWAGAVRLILPAAADRYAATARACGLQLIAADGSIVVTPHGYALVRPAEPGAPASEPPQWRSYLVDGGSEAMGLLAPSPPWERGLPQAGEFRAGIRLRRVPAGLAIEAAADRRDQPAGPAAEKVWPDPQRVTIVVGPGQRAQLRDALAALLSGMALEATDGVRLYWRRAGAGTSRSELLELARQCETDLIAPVGDLSALGFGAVSAGPAGAAPWVRLTSTGGTELAGSLYPAPPWEQSLGDTELEGIPEPVRVEHVAAGLCVYRPDRAGRGFIATARSILPDPDQLTVVVGGSADDADVRNDVEEVLKRIPVDSARHLRLLLADAGGRRGASFGQQLADGLGAQITAPVAGWTATPNGRVLALPPGGHGTPDPAAPRWAEFSPPSREPSLTLFEAEPAPVSPGPAGPGLATPADQPADPAESADPAEPAGPAEPAAPAELGQLATEALAPVADQVPDRSVETAGVAVIVLPRDYKSSGADRRRYRESAARYQSHLVAVRRVLTQRPGLRGAAAGDAQEAAVTDFAAVLDFMADDRYATTAALRSGGAGTDPRVACVISGFRRLPSFTGAVFTSAFLGGLSPDSYLPGAFLLEPAFVLATSSHVVAIEGDIDYVIWSQTGKRLAALSVDAARDEIVFPAGTMFRVLTVYRPPGPDERALAFLREWVRPAGDQPLPDPSEPFDEMDHRVLARMGEAASMRNAVPPDDRTLSRAAASGPLLIGLNASGVLFRPRSR
jgi:hypothetical protein